MLPEQWDIVDVDFGDPIGHEQAFRRPAVVVSNTSFNHHAHLATVCPITSARTAPKYPSEVELPNLPGIVTQGVILAQQIRTVSTDRVVKIRGPMKDPVLQRQVVEAVLALLGAGQ